MIRYNFLPLDRTINDVNFYDLTRLDWNQFRFKRGIRTIKLTKLQVDRFYLLTEAEYDNLINEDIILYANKILDPTTLEVGQEIILPDPQDIQDFLVEQLGVQS